MKKIILSIAFIAATASSIWAQDIGTVVLQMPESIIFGLEASEKDVLIADVKDTAQISVDRGTYADIKRLAVSSDYICLQTSDVGTTQIKLLPLVNDSKIICVIKTVCGKACDSQIQFYTTKWLPITQGDLFSRATKESFIKPDADRESQEFKNAYIALDMTPLKMTLSPKDNTLTVEYDIKNYLSEEEYKKIQPFLIEQPKVFNWDKISYK